MTTPAARAVPGTGDGNGSEPEAAPARLPVSPKLGRLLLLLVVFLCAACGLVYELALVALSSYLTGDSVTQASLVLSVMVFAMGVGSLLAKNWTRRAVTWFALIEALLALTGGLSAFALYGCFAWFGQSAAALVVFSFGIGVLIGGEVPLLMTLIQRIRRQEAAGAVADLFAADYVGALVGGLAFPFLMLPLLGQLEAALLTGVVNALAGSVVVLWLFRADLTRRRSVALGMVNAVVLATLTGGALAAPSFEDAARQAIYGASVRLAERTAVQEVVLTGHSAHSLQLFLDGQRRACGKDEYHYHEALVHPAMAGPHRSVLILGGGDGLALREVLRYGDVRRVTVVDADPGLVRIARTDPELSALNERAHDDPRVREVGADIFDWLRTRARPGGYDVVLADLPPYAETRSAKLYSQEFYGLVRRALSGTGRLALPASFPGDRSQVYRTVDAGVRAGGLLTMGYRLGETPGQRRGGRDGRPASHSEQSDEWWFVLASRHRPFSLGPASESTGPGSPGDEVSLRGGGRHLRLWLWQSCGESVQPSTLLHPRYFG